MLLNVAEINKNIIFIKEEKLTNLTHGKSINGISSTVQQYDNRLFSTRNSSWKAQNSGSSSQNFSTPQAYDTEATTRF